jgi:hypothetical protein
MMHGGNSKLDKNNFILQQNGALSHFHLQVWQFLNVSYTDRLAEILTETWLCCNAFQDHLTTLPRIFVYASMLKKLCICHHYQETHNSCNNIQYQPKLTGWWWWWWCKCAGRDGITNWHMKCHSWTHRTQTEGLWCNTKFEMFLNTFETLWCSILCHILVINY